VTTLPKAKTPAAAPAPAPKAKLVVAPSEPGADLCSSSLRQCCARTAIFFLGLLLLDQTILRVGDRLAASPYWNDDIPARLSDPEEWDALILGTCRAFFLRTPRLKALLEKRFFNAGLRTSRISTMAVSLELAKYKAQGKPLILMIDDYILESTPEMARQELQGKTTWLSRLSAEDRIKINQRTEMSDLDSFRQNSGLEKYQGLGASLRIALTRWMRGQPAPRALPEHVGGDQYTPYMAGTLKVDADLAKHQKRESTHTEFALKWLDSMVGEAIQAGMKPVLVLPPMHRLAATVQANASLARAVGEIASSHRVPLLNYLDGDGEWVSRDDLWTEVTHLNAKGADFFTERLAHDLRGLL